MSDPGPTPDDVHNWQRMGGQLLAASRARDALHAFDQALRIAPAQAQGHAGRGLSLLALGRDTEALEALTRAVDLDPAGASGVLLQAGYQLLELARADAAHAAFSVLVERQPTSRPARLGQAMTLMALRRFAEAAAALAILLAEDGGTDYLQGVALHARLQCCDWRGYEEDRAAIVQRVRRGERADAPLSFIVHGESPADQLGCARTYASHRCAADAPAVARNPRPAADRLRIAYLSSDLRDHAVGQCLVEVLEAHDRTRFDVHAFSTGPDDGSALRLRLMRAVEHFEDVKGLADREIAARMGAAGIDIAVDLGGHSSGGRMRVLAFRPAPVQVSFLGFPGTTGAPYVDYLIADERVVPEAQRGHYSEHVVYLPDTCFPTPRMPALARLARAQARLPDEGFIFCAFHGPHKISPRMFDCWMRVLEAVPGSVLWLRQAPAVVYENLTGRAASHGIAANRLVFAARTATRDDHLARLALADAFLDTFPYGAHTTASEALLARVPVITLTGSAFASRVAYSLLHARGLPSLAVDTIERYEELAVTLARQPAELGKLKRSLGETPTGNALFAPEVFCRQLERAYRLMDEHRVRGKAPTVLRVTTL